MFDERAFIKQFEAADAQSMARTLARPTSEQETALRLYLGDSRYTRMHNTALQATAARRGLTTPSKGRVVVIHGIMGAELSNFDSPSSPESSKVWVHYWRIFRGWVERLLLNADGLTSPYDVRATGIMQDYYGELVLELLVKNWDAQSFWFDWRKDINAAARELHTQINGWFGTDTPVHIVAHSMGGVVSQAFIKNHVARWKSMWDDKPEAKGARGGRLVMLGTPSYGSFIIPQVITGLEPMVRKLALLDGSHDLRGVLGIVNTFPGSYQMLPSPFIKRDEDVKWSERMRRLYRSDLYGDLRVPQHHLDSALKFQEKLQYVDQPERMIYIAGYNQNTLSDLRDPSQVASANAYEVTKLGDGRVTHELGIPRTKDDKQIENVFYIDEAHAELPRNSDVIAVMDELLEKGTTKSVLLRRSVASGVRAAQSRSAAAAAERENYVIEQEAEFERFRLMVAPLRWSRGGEPQLTVSREERKVREGLLGSPVLEREQAQDNGRLSMSAVKKRTDGEVGIDIEIRLEWGGIESTGEERVTRASRRRDAQPPVDAISVGHYAGVGKPLMAEQKLDEAISRALMRRKYGPKDKIPDVEKLLALYSDRNIVRGSLGQPFFIPDPRSNNGRLIVLAGMGEAGRFGAPELTVLARELCWSLGRLGKKHLATVLIGAGQGNLPRGPAVTAWLRGIGQAVTSSRHDEDWRLQRVTFVEIDPSKVESIEDAIMDFQKNSQSFAGETKLRINYQPLDFAKVKNQAGLTIYEEIERREKERWEEQKEKRKEKQKQGAKEQGSENDPVPVRITLGLEGKKYRFGAITENASIPEREIPLDPVLVMEANQKLPGLGDIGEQQKWGRYMENLLMPKDLRPVFSTPAPVVMTLDASTARIHWEMIAQPDISQSNKGKSAASESRDTQLGSFLGTSRGFTRQLRNTFAPTAEPPPPPSRVLRVLVVADPQEEERLPGAEQEGREIAELFRSFNKVWKEADNQVEVVTLFGPDEATRNQVLFHLTQSRYDILHYAGHCMFDENEPSASGWLFSKGAVLSANELNRVDHIPKFVFSNACESGITPDRASQRSPSLAPSFAEAFFARGVANFVCTAWLVDDAAAREFALQLYSKLLGVERNEKGEFVPGEPEAMHRAMHLARLEIAQREYGLQTWGAYQHYGNPRLRFFDKEALTGTGGAATASSGKRQSKKKSEKSAPKARRKTARAGSGATARGKRVRRGAAQQ
ncbi:MAG TPA: CHAT domain-containing protein [Pyrinomonadaceae bacterium]|nr:CHAT domain-containing protein [Pyrinomonadaceae bacterium]